MLRVLRDGFSPISSDLCGFSGDTHRITIEAETFAVSFERQIAETGNVFVLPEYKTTDPQIAALAEMTITELVYFQHSSKLAQSFISSYSGRFDCIVPSLLIACEKIQQEMTDVCNKLTIIKPILSATTSEHLSSTQQHHYHRKLVSTVFTRFGGGHASIEVQVPMNGIFEQICCISKLIWSVLNVCSMLTDHIDFHSISIGTDTTDSIFANNGWRTIEKISLVNYSIV
jgi:hypothetical protein